jgi:hypothetical protein
MEYDFPIVVEDYDKTDDVHIWETELHDFIVLYIVPGKECVTLGICVTAVLWLHVYVKVCGVGR